MLQPAYIKVKKGNLMTQKFIEKKNSEELNQEIPNG